MYFYSLGQNFLSIQADGRGKIINIVKIERSVHIVRLSAFGVDTSRILLDFSLG